MKKITIEEFNSKNNQKVSIYGGNLKMNNPTKWNKKETDILIFLLKKYSYLEIKEKNKEIRNNPDLFKPSIAVFVNFKSCSLPSLFGIEKQESQCLAFMQKRHGYNSLRVKLKDLDNLSDFDTSQSQSYDKEI